MEIRSISPAAAFRVALTVLAVVVALRFLWIAHAIFIVLFLGVLLGLALSRAVDLLERVHVRRGIGAPLALLVVLGALIAIVALAAPSIREQARDLSRELPRAMRMIEQRLGQSPAKVLVTQSVPATAPAAPRDAVKPPSGKEARSEEPASPPASLPKEAQGLTKFLFPLVSSTAGAVGGVIMVLFIAMYLAAEPALYKAGMLHLVPKRHRPRALELGDAIGETLRRWLVARLLAMLLVGTVTGVALALLDVRGAAALGILSGLLEFIPFFGPVASAIPAIGIAFVDSPQKALSVAILYIVIQQLEGSVLTPLLLSKRLDIPPVLTIVTVAALGVVFGVLGMLIAEPLLAMVMVTTKMLYVEDVVGDPIIETE